MLLDELDFPGFGVPDPRTGHIVVEMRTPHSAALLKYSCSGRVLALPTVQLNARRLVLLLADSAASSVARCLLSVSLSAVCQFVCCLSVCQSVCCLSVCLLSVSLSAVCLSVSLSAFGM